jgi:hypothetical protein
MSSMLKYIQEDMLANVRYQDYQLDCDPINATSRHLVSKYLGFAYYPNFTNNQQIAAEYHTLRDSLKRAKLHAELKNRHQ